jgi:hypothetical protein
MEKVYRGGGVEVEGLDYRTNDSWSAGGFLGGSGNLLIRIDKREKNERKQGAKE